MKDTEFNLLDESWIRVMTFENEIKEVSLTEALVNAHQYKSLCGEIPTQDIVLLRLLLAVLHTVFSRVDTQGNDLLIEDEDDAVEFWKELWKLKKFPEKPLKEYFKEWHERFWLFHPERPFGQIAELNFGTEYDASKLNGEISESSNKKRIFSAYSGNSKNTLSYSQAARWLLYLNAYDDTSAKPTKEGKSKAGGKLPSPGAGWLGQLGIIYISGNNLFETLMLNFVLNNNGILQINSEECKNVQNPLWEREKAPYKERVEISRPENLAELYTLQSRRIHLNRNDNCEVADYILIGGDFFSKENAFAEPMTVWRVPKKDGEAYTPKRHDPSKQMWREFSSIYNNINDKKDSSAGVIKWCQEINSDRHFKFSDTITTKIVSVQYGDKDFFVNHIFSDKLSMNSQLLSDVGAAMRRNIQNEIEKCDSLAKAVGNFAKDLYIASGGTKGDTKNPDKGYDNAGKNAMAQLYYRLDMPFRQWLLSVDVETEDYTRYCDDKINEWQEKSKKIASDYVDELAENAGEKTMTGHLLNEKLYCLPRAKISFRGRLNEIYKKI